MNDPTPEDLLIIINLIKSATIRSRLIIDNNGDRIIQTKIAGRLFHFTENELGAGFTFEQIPKREYQIPIGMSGLYVDATENLQDRTLILFFDNGVIVTNLDDPEELKSAIIEISRNI